MTFTPLTIDGLSFLGPEKNATHLVLGKGVNVICGATDTGKSFVVEAIDYLLGGSSLRDLPELSRYDRARIALRNGGSFTLERGLDGEDFLLAEGNHLVDSLPSERTTLRAKKQTTKIESLSNFLLERIGLENRLLKAKEGKTQRLGFRNLAKLVIIDEESIIKKSPPFLTGQWTMQTPEHSLLKLLLTGVDASAVQSMSTPVGDKDNESRSREFKNLGRAELYSELIAGLNKKIENAGIDFPEVLSETFSLETSLNQTLEQVDILQADLDHFRNLKKELEENIRPISSRLAELDALFSRFDLLSQTYDVDIDRLRAIAESGTLFVHFATNACPLCGTPAEEQHASEGCDSDVASVVEAASAEIEKINLLQSELRLTVAQLSDERVTLEKELAALQLERIDLTGRISKGSEPLNSGRDSIRTMLIQLENLRSVKELFEQRSDLELKRNSAPMEEPDSPPSSDVEDVASVIGTTQNQKLPTSVLDGLSQEVKAILDDWHFPESDRVHFDPSLDDFVINGRARGSRGKGLRAITHAAFTIGLMNYCRSHDLPHPGFVILDSPLLAYWKPEGEEDRLLAGTDLKQQFYRYLNDYKEEGQIVIIENEHPPIALSKEIELIVFTRNPDQGRYGLFPFENTRTPSPE